MFTPPAERTAVRGSALGPVTAYALFLLAWPIVLWGVRGSITAMLVVIGVGVAAIAGAAFFAAGASVTVDADEIVVTRRFRPPWRTRIDDFRYVSENIPSRPRQTALAGWTFRTGSGDEAKLELSHFAPGDRRRLRALFREVIVDADVALKRRSR